MFFEQNDEHATRKIHAIEPHPDDVLGSASGLCYSLNVEVALHTICHTGDERDAVLWDEKIYDTCRKVRKKVNIAKHCKYELKDLHWDNRIQGKVTDYAALVRAYQELYGTDRTNALYEVIDNIVCAAEREDAYIAFPLGIEHPMHILVAQACADRIREHQFNTNKVILYVDHPYDYQNAGNGRLQMVKENFEKEFGVGAKPDTSVRLCRCDDVSIDQAELKSLISEVYGDRHYGEFDGSLENTNCSYFIRYSALDDIKEFLKIHVNNILYITFQAKPYKKTGGLGEVAYTYCRALKDFVNDVRIMMPYYRESEIGEKVRQDYKLTYKSSAETEEIPYTIKEREYDGLIYYMLDMKNFNAMEGKQAAEGSGSTAALFCDVIMQQALKEIDYLPNILHCNDWQTALIPMLHKTKYKDLQPNLKVIYTIHFYGYKGIFSKKRILRSVGLDEENCRLCVTCDKKKCPLNRIELLSEKDISQLSAVPSQMSFMKCGIEFADAVTTVSKGYAQEMQSNYPDFSKTKVTGIRNGIDCADRHFDAGSGFSNFDDVTDVETFRAVKDRNKAMLQQRLGLDQKGRMPLVCMVSRLNVVKGLEVVKNVINEILAIPVQFVIVGDDDKADCGACLVQSPYANFFRAVEKANLGKFVYREFSEELEYQVYAGADILLMPSLSEACGTTQMFAMKYGVVPIVSMISAFGDTVLDYKFRSQKKKGEHLDKGIGFYAYKDDCWVLLEVLKKAVQVYRGEEKEEDTWDDIALDCMKVDFSWKSGSVHEYLKLYNGL